MYGAPVPRITLRTLARLFLGGLTAAAAMLPAERASASSYLVIPPAAAAEASAAYKYANMTDVEAVAELDKRKVPYKKAESIAGVVAPVRLTGKLHGVWIHSSIPESQRATSMYEVLDARLALALDDFAKILERHDIEEVVHYSLYRPNVPREHDEGAHVAARELAANTKAASVTAKSASVTAKAAPATAKGTASDAKTTAAAPKAPAVIGTSVAQAKAGAKPGPATGAKSPLPAKAHGAKTSLPAAPVKALPQPVAKAPSTAHGAKRKDPPASEKPALPALPAPPAQAPKGHAPHAAAHAATHAAAPQANLHAKVTATAKGAAPVRTRVATPTKGATPAKSTSPSQAATTKSAPASAAGAKSATPASTAKSATPASGAKIPTPATTAKSATPASATKILTPATTAKSATPASATKVATTASAAKNAPAVTVAKSGTGTSAAPASRQKWAAPGTRHPAGLAIDVALLKKRDGQWISVARDFQGKIGAKTCGDGVRTADTPEGRELRSLVCEANDLGVFTYVLTPNFNAAHYDHFHMEIRPTVKWFLYH